MSGWPIAALGDVADILVGYAFKSDQFTTGGGDRRLLRGVNVAQGLITWGQEARWPASLPHDSRYELADGDVLLAMDRPWIEAGLKRARIRPPDLPALLVQRVARLRGTEDALTSFVHHTLATERFSRYLQGQVTGATVPHISQTQIAAYSLSLPPIDVQRRVCAVLDAYDDLIENNRRRVEVLEEMARTIYREWFVHFRYPGHEAGSLVDSALGLIPEGWTVGRVDSCFVLQRGFDLPLQERDAGTVPVVGASGVQGRHSAAKVSGPGLTTGRSGTIGTVTFVHENFWPLNTSLWVKEFRLATPRFAFFMLSDLDLRKASSGAAVPSLNRNVVHSIPVVCPPRHLIERWDAAAATTFDVAENLRQQAGRVIAVRDLLLPKLMAGQIDVSTLDLDAPLAERVA